MTPDDTPVPGDDAIARAAREGLSHLAGSHAPIRLDWASVALRARRVRQRRLIALVAACMIVLATSGVVVAATSDGDHVSIEGAGETPSSTTTTESSTTTTETSTTVTQPSVTETRPAIATPTTVPAQPAQAGDFTGRLQHFRQICNPCLSTGFEKGIVFVIRNNTDHPIDLSTAAPVRVAQICATNMTSDGRLTKPLPSWPTDIFADEKFENGSASGLSDYSAPGTRLAPGAEVASNSIYSYGIDGGIDPGTATCEGALVSTSDGSWNPETLSVVSRLANIPVYTFQVVDPPPATTTRATTTTSTSTSTTTTSLP